MLPAGAAPHPAVFQQFAEAGIAVYSGDIVGHGKSEGHRALMESYTDAVSGSGCHTPVLRACGVLERRRRLRSCCLSRAGDAGSGRAAAFGDLPKANYCCLISTRQVDEFLALCAHAWQDVAARHPSATVPFFIAGERVPQGTVDSVRCHLAVYSTPTGSLLAGGSCWPFPCSFPAPSCSFPCLFTPALLPGHSLGGLIAALACLRDQSAWSGLLLCSAALDVEMGLVLRCAWVGCWCTPSMPAACCAPVCLWAWAGC